MKVLVTGHRGYIGTHLVELLQDAGCDVTGCDLGLFAGCAWEAEPQPEVELAKDTRQLTKADLRDHACVMHLAALSNDPMGDINPALTRSVNLDASVRLARLCKEAGVARFIFASSCSSYGKGSGPALTEQAALNPLSAYAQAKIEAERQIAQLADDEFTPVFMRNATAYGHSPMLRIDLVVNNLLASALSYGEIRIQSDGEPWRPLIHCRDIARGMVAFMQAERAGVHGKVVNVGGNRENYQVKDVAAQVRRLLPEAEVCFTGETGEDPRNYQVNFDLLGELLPDFRLQYCLADGMAELHAKMVEHGFGASDFEGSQFVRLRKLKENMGLLAPAA